MRSSLRYARLESCSESPFPLVFVGSFGGMAQPIVAVDHITKRFAGHTAVDALSALCPCRSDLRFAPGERAPGRGTSIRMILKHLCAR